MKFFIHKPERKPGIDESLCIVKTWDGQIVECTFDKDIGYFYTRYGTAGYKCDVDIIQWWCYRDRLISHLESEEE
jgi:hypothetical protein